MGWMHILDCSGSGQGQVAVYCEHAKELVVFSGRILFHSVSFLVHQLTRNSVGQLGSAQSQYGTVQLTYDPGLCELLIPDIFLGSVQSQYGTVQLTYDPGLCVLLIPDIFVHKLWQVQIVTNTVASTQINLARSQHVAKIMLCAFGLPTTAFLCGRFSWTVTLAL